MNKLFLALILLGLGFTASQAQNTTVPAAQPPALNQGQIIGEPPVDVPDVVVRNFVSDFPNCEHSQWEKSGNNLVAVFMENDANVRAFYSTDGKLILTKREVHASILPAAASDYISKHYAGKKITLVWKETNDKGETYYEAKAGESKLKFDSNGTLVATPTHKKANKMAAAKNN